MLIDIQIVGHQIKRARLKAKISQAKFARQADVSRATLIGIENGTIKEIGVNRLNRVVLASQSLGKASVQQIDGCNNRKSASLNLSFPYDWSNSSMPDALLIDKVVERGLFEDMVKIAVRYGTDPLRSSVSSFTAKNPVAAPSLIRMLGNIEKGLNAAA